MIGLLSLPLQPQFNSVGDNNKGLLMRIVKEKKIKDVKTILFLCVICLHCQGINLYAQNRTSSPNIITFAIGNQHITVAGNGDVLAVVPAGTASYPNNNVMTVDYSDVAVDVNRNISVWKDEHRPSVFYFPIDKYLLRRDYYGNASMLNDLDELIQSPYVLGALDTIEIIGSCSPIASEEYNLKLALSRCMALRSYLRSEHLDFAESFPIKFSIIGIDHLGYSILKKQQPPLTEKQIWDRLQYSAIRLKMKDGNYLIPGADKPKEVEQMYCKNDTLFLRDTIIIRDCNCDPPAIMPAPEKKQVFIALKSNLIYDAALLPNLTAEFYLGNKWSLAIEGNWSWWTWTPPVQNLWYHRVQVAGLELRRWVKSPYPLQGHALGVYSMVGNYDLRFVPKDENSIGELSYLSWSAGLSYAYSFPIAHRFNIELGLAAGYVGGTYYKYDYCMEESQWEKQAMYNRNYIGPTRLSVSLVWLLATGNDTNRKKK